MVEKEKRRRRKKRRDEKKTTQRNVLIFEVLLSLKRDKTNDV